MAKTRKSHAIAERMRLLDASGIRKVFDLAAKMTDPINLSIGQPDFDVPQAVKDARHRGHPRREEQVHPDPGHAAAPREAFGAVPRGVRLGRRSAATW